MRKNLGILFVSIFLLISLTEKSAVAEGLGLSLGALGGYSSLNASNEFGVGNGSFGFGAIVGFEFLSILRVNAEWTSTSTTPSGTTTGFTSNLSAYDVSVDYIIPLIPTKFEIFLGPMLGSGTTSAGGSSGSSMTLGGQAGADFFTSSSFSIGAEINYLSVAAPTINGTSGNSGSLIQLLAALKYWL